MMINFQERSVVSSSILLQYFLLIHIAGTGRNKGAGDGNLAGFHALPASDQYLDAAGRVKKLVPDLAEDLDSSSDESSDIPYLRSGRSKM